MWYTRLDKLAVLSVSGGDNRSFLQGQLTQDLLKLTADRSLLTGWANPKGRLICTMQLCQHDDEIWLLLPAELVGTVTQRLTLFVLRADVQFAAADVAVYGLTNLPAVEPYALADLRLPAGAGAAACSAEMLAARAVPDASRALVLGAEALVEPLLAAQGEATDSVEWARAEISAGVPVITSPVSETFVPQMVNLDLLGGISFSKGCYVGQEVVARTQNLGRIKRRMFRFGLKGPAEVRPGDALLDGDGAKTGTVVSVAGGVDDRELLAVVPLGQETGPLRTGDGRPVVALPLPYEIPALDG